MDRPTGVAMAAVTLLWCAGLALVMGSSPAEGGFGLANYALDDPYIHMSVARHLVEDGVWGISASHSAAATSSPLWTAVIAACFLVTGPVGVLPLVLQLPVLLGLVRALSTWLAPWGPGRGAALSVALVLFMGLPTLLLTGMEHLLHALLAVVLLWLGGREQESSSAELVALAAACGAAMAVRYETVFLLLGTAVALSLRGRWRELAAGHGAAGVVLLGVGMLNISQGVGFLPNSVVAKSAFIRSEGSFEALFSAVTGVPAHLASHEPSLLGTVLLMWAGMLAVCWSSREPLVRDAALAVSAAVVGQLAFAQLGWLFRYEAWLVLLLSVVTVRALATTRPSSPVIWTLLGLAVALGGLRLGWSTWAAVASQSDIRRQHLAMSAALATRPRGSVVVANDVGAISFYTDIDVVDLVGLGDNEVLTARRRGTWGKEFLEELAARRGAELAVVYESWFQGGRALPDSWTPVADWDAGQTTVAGSPVVSWYAIGLSPEDLRGLLEASPPPRDVTVHWR